MIGSWANTANAPRVPAGEPPNHWRNGRPDWGWIAREKIEPAPAELRRVWMVHDELATGFPDAAYLAGIQWVTELLGGDGWLFIVPPRVAKGEPFPTERMRAVADVITAAGFAGVMLDAAGNDVATSCPAIFAMMLNMRGLKCLCEPSPLHRYSHWLWPGRGCVCQSYNLPRWHPTVWRYGLNRVMERGGTAAIEVVRRGRDTEFDPVWAVKRCHQLRKQFPGAVLFTPAGKMGPEHWAALTGA